MPRAHEDAYRPKGGPRPGRKQWRGVAFTPDGERRTRTGFPTEAAALLWAVNRERELADEAEEAARQAALPADLPTVRQWWERRRGLLGVSERSLDTTSTNMRLYVVPKWGDTPLDRLSRAEVSDWLQRLMSGPEPGDRLPGRYDRGELRTIKAPTVRRMLADFKVLVLAAVDQDMLPASPIARVRVQAGREAKQRAARFMPVDDARQAIGHLPEDMQPLFTVLLQCGLRLGEAAALDGDRREDPKHLVIKQVLVEPDEKGRASKTGPPVERRGQSLRPAAKGGEQRVVPLPARATAELDAYLAAHPPVTVTLRQADDEGRVGTGTVDKRLWFTVGGKPLRRRPVEAAWERAQKAAGIGTPYRVHDLRHTFASVLLRKGVPLVEVGRLMGHAPGSPATLIYQHLAGDQNDAARAILDGMFDQ